MKSRRWDTEMNIQSKVSEYRKAESQYKDSEGRTIEDMKDNGWDYLLNTANNNLYQQIFGMSVDKAIDQEWHEDFINALIESY